MCVLFYLPQLVEEARKVGVRLGRSELSTRTIQQSFQLGECRGRSACTCRGRSRAPVEYRKIDLNSAARKPTDVDLLKRSRAGRLAVNVPEPPKLRARGCRVEQVPSDVREAPPRQHASAAARATDIE